MMLLFVRDLGDRVYEIDGIGKVVELKCSLDVLLLQFPFRNFLEPVFQLIRFHKVRHNGERVTPQNGFAMENRRTFFNNPEGGYNLRILRKFRAESNTSTAHSRALRECRSQFCMTSIAAAAAAAAFSIKNIPHSRGR